MLPFTLQQLRILKAIAKEKNFTKAAQLLYLSQPSLSRQIKTLENNLGILLIHRKKNKVSLTENGIIFLHYSERILALCEESCRTLIDLKHAERGNLIIGASQTIGAYLIPRILALFARNYPQISLKVCINASQVIASNVVNKKIDIAIVDEEIPNEFKKNLTIENFVEDELNLIVSKFHPLATKKKITKKDLYQLNFLTLNSNSNLKKLTDNLLLQNHIETQQLKTMMQFNSIEGIKTAVSLGLGAAFLSSSTIIKEIELQKIEILNIEGIQIRQKLFIISNPNCYKSKVFDFFYNELEKFKNNIEY